MAYDWAGLLGEIDTYSARRVSSLVDDDEERRRRGRALALVAVGEPAQRRYLPTGIVGKTGQNTASSRQPTITSILRPPQTSQQEIITLTGALGSGR
ncbi:hypothetical protein GHK48_00485, partial [Sinorhizobium fredii]